MTNLVTKTLTLIKKNRVYFDCTNESGYKVKLRVDEKSKDLEIGKHELLLNDESITSKYGTQLIYSIAAESKSEEKILLKSRYNKNLVDACKKLGGQFEWDEKAWVFNDAVSDKVEELEYLYNTDIVTVEIKAKDDMVGYQDAIYFFGYSIAKAEDRDSGATICRDVSMISGKISSGGSQKNWLTKIEKDSVFRLKISKNLLSESDENFEIKIIQ